MAIFCLQSKGSTCCAQHVETVTGYPCQDCLLPGRPVASRPSSTFFKTLRIVWWSLWWWYNPLIYQVSPAIVQWLVKMIWRWLEKVRDYPSSAHSQNIRKNWKVDFLWSPSSGPKQYEYAMISELRQPWADPLPSATSMISLMGQFRGTVNPIATICEVWMGFLIFHVLSARCLQASSGIKWFSKCVI